MRHDQIDLLCTRCGSGYSSSHFCVEQIAPHMSWEAVPSDWRCQGCGAPKSCLEPQEIVYQCVFFALARL
jgi:rubredoxin